jgi:alpha-tubulin suppressor-like RCC1 family protein
MAANILINGIDTDSIFITRSEIGLPTYYPNNSGGMWASGLNSGNVAGALGIADITPKSSPVQIGALTDWKQISGNRHSHVAWKVSFCAVKTDGSMWAWGNNDSGQIGNSSNLTVSSPIQIGSLKNWKQVSVGGHVLAVKSDNTLWTWGIGAGVTNSGENGLNDLTLVSSPVQVGTLTNWKQVSAGRSSSAAIKTDRTLWTWGLNSTGQIGDGTVINRSSPVQIGNLTNWKQVSAGDGITAAVKVDGSLWTWGNNSDGQLGDGTVISKSSPIQIGALRNWKSVSVGGYGGNGFVGAVKTDGTLWAWGKNAFGQLGDGTVLSRSSPIQIGSDVNWKEVFTSDARIHATKTDGTLWAWGYNNNGELMSGDVEFRSSPIQVGTLATWQSVAPAINATIAIRT